MSSGQDDELIAALRAGTGMRPHLDAAATRIIALGAENERLQTELDEALCDTTIECELAATEKILAALRAELAAVPESIAQAIEALYEGHVYRDGPVPEPEMRTNYNEALEAAARIARAVTAAPSPVDTTEALCVCGHPFAEHTAATMGIELLGAACVTQPDLCPCMTFRPAVTTTEARDEAHRLLRLALHLRMNGERAPGGTETWRDFDAPCERYLRALDDATPEVSS